MAAAAEKPKLIAIVGPTASGKTALGIKIAKEFDGEVIAADSRTVYRGMDIGTAKPTQKEISGVAHWGLDLVNPGESYNAAKFQSYAKRKIAEIHSRGKLPILVGGTGLYIDSVLFDFSFGPVADVIRRKEFESLEVSQLQDLIAQNGLEMPENAGNKRHLVRVLETNGAVKTRQGLLEGALAVGLLPSLDKLKSRMDKRAELMFKAGVLKETERLVARYGKDSVERSAGIVYRVCLGVLRGEIDKNQAIDLCKTAEWQYSRRQRTWFKRNPHINWFEDSEKAFNFVKSRMNT